MLPPRALRLRRGHGRGGVGGGQRSTAYPVSRNEPDFHVFFASQCEIFPYSSKVIFCSSGDSPFCSKSVASIHGVKINLGKDDEHYHWCCCPVNQWQERGCFFYQS